MKIILLSGGSGKRLWPLSNDARSKQFLRLLSAPDGHAESMIQRVVRQIREANLTDDIVVGTGISQKDSIENQLGNGLSVVTEPCRRDTFPAIALACAYLRSQGTAPDEPVIVMPCDTYTEAGYFTAIAKMAAGVQHGDADLVLMGIAPTYASSKYGYIIPADGCTPGCNGVCPVQKFTEKPDVETAARFIAEGGMWNGGVFAFRLGYLNAITDKYMPGKTFAEIREKYAEMPKISFDYEVVEKAQSVGVVRYDGEWKDLGTWNTLTDELPKHNYGNVHSEDCENTFVINELELPIVCLGAKDMVVAASPDGILVSDRNKSENLKHIVDNIGKRPMYEERRWGEYKVIDYVEFPDGFCSLTKQLTVKPGCNISYQRHSCRNEVWTFISGEGILVIEDEVRRVQRGDTVVIPVGTRHAIRAVTPLTFIEVQSGSNLCEEDIERFDYTWSGC